MSCSDTWEESGHTDNQRFPSLETVHAELSHQHTPPPDPRIQIDQRRTIEAIRQLSPLHNAIVTAMEHGKYLPRMILKFIAEHPDTHTMPPDTAVTLEDVNACLADMRNRKP